MTTDYDEFIGRIEDLYENIYPKPKDPFETFARNLVKPNSNNDCPIADPRFELMDQLRSHINGRIVYSIEHPEEYETYNKKLKEWEDTKKKEFPKFKKIYMFKHFLKENNIFSQEDLDSLYKESLKYPSEIH